MHTNIVILLLIVFTSLLVQPNELDDECECPHCMKLLAKTPWYTSIFNKKASVTYDTLCESRDFNMQIDALAFGTYSHSRATSDTRWRLILRNYWNSSEVYYSLSTIQLPTTSSTAVKCFDLSGESPYNSCVPFILPTSAIHFEIRCENKWHDCPLQYKLYTSCVPRLNTTKRETWDVRYNSRLNRFESTPAADLILNYTSNQIQMKNRNNWYNYNYRVPVYAVYHEPVYRYGKDSWLFQVDDLDTTVKPDSDGNTWYKVTFGFITDQFPMNHQSQGEWEEKTVSEKAVQLSVTRQFNVYCIDKKATTSNDELPSVDGHYHMDIGSPGLTKGDEVRIDIERYTDSTTGELRTLINVIRNRQTTRFEYLTFPQPVPSLIYPVVGFKRNGTVTIKRIKQQ